MFANNYISTIVETQLPDFVKADHPNFVALLKRYYQYLEQTDKTVYTNKRLYDYFDVDSTRADLVQYFKTKIIPNFPELTELSTEKIIKFAKYFYSKKGTPESLKFLFRILYGQEIDVYFPKQDILRASDGRWKLPQALRISVGDTSSIINGGTVNVSNITANVVTANGINLISSGVTANSFILIGSEKRKVTSVTSNGEFLVVEIPFANTGGSFLYSDEKIYKLTASPYEDFNFNLLEKRKGTGELSKTTCVIENAVKTVDKSTGREIVELYVSNVQRPFETNENILISYVDPTANTTKIFSAKIISLISNINLARKKSGEVLNGRKYRTGDPVVFVGGLNEDSVDALEAVATVGNVTAGSIDTISLVKDGYFFRDDPNSIIQIVSNSGVDANVIIQAIWEDNANSNTFNFNTDSIALKASIPLNNVTFNFAANTVNISNTLSEAFTFETIRLGKIRLLSLVEKGTSFEDDPLFNIVSVYDTDYTQSIGGFFKIPAGQFSNYNLSIPSIQLNETNVSYSTANGYYTGARLFVDTGDNAHYVTVTDYVVNDVSLSTMTKTLYLDELFENNINPTNIQTLSLFMDFRPDVRLSGQIGAIEVANGGSGYSATNDVLEFLGTGYGANATLNISSGVITGVNIINRGEGYYSAPTCRVMNSVTGNISTGVGASFNVYTFSDGEIIDTQVGDLGAIQSFRIINRGFDYAATPNVSLKIVDVLTANLSSNTVVLSGDKVWQGTSLSDSSFNGTVDQVYRVGNKAVIRVFDYNGLINAGLGLSVNTSTQNISVNIVTSVENISYDGVTPADERPYPKFYGDGLAKANVEFLNGLIKYDGYYLNTDGFISWDKKLQNNNYFHNYSYEIQSEKPLHEYKETINSIAHPAGMHLLSKYIIRDQINENIAISSNVHTTNTALPGNVTTNYSTTLVNGNGTDFANTANVGDLIIINSSALSNYRMYVKEITAVDGNTQILTIESPVGAIGDGRLLIQTGNTAVSINGNTLPLSTTLQIGDQIGFILNGNTYYRIIDNIQETNKILILNSTVADSGNNVVYRMAPFVIEEDYKIITVNG